MSCHMWSRRGYPGENAKLGILSDMSNEELQMLTPQNKLHDSLLEF